jgi:hypothetical protein
MPTLAEQIAAAKAGGTAAAAAPATTAAPVVAAPETGSLLGMLGKTAAVSGAATGPLGGGDRLATVRDALRTASVGNKRNDLPLGTGAFLLKSGKYSVTDDQKYKISSFSFLCLVGIRDGAGQTFGVDGYAGPIPGETYDISIFQDFSPKYSKGTLGKNLSALQACMGWTKEQVKLFQSTDEGLDKLMKLLEGLLCVSMDDSTPTGQPSLFSNQVVVQLSTSTSISEVKDKNTGQPLYIDAQGTKATKTYINTYWDKKIPVADLPGLIGDAKTIDAFGTKEAFVKAHENEQALAEMFK